jgi:hypothetical protein
MEPIKYPVERLRSQLIFTPNSVSQPPYKVVCAMTLWVQSANSFSYIWFSELSYGCVGTICTTLPSSLVNCFILFSNQRANWKWVPVLVMRDICCRSWSGRHQELKFWSLHCNGWSTAQPAAKAPSLLSHQIHGTIWWSNTSSFMTGPLGEWEPQGVTISRRTWPAPLTPTALLWTPGWCHSFFFVGVVKIWQQSMSTNYSITISTYDTQFVY